MPPSLPEVLLRWRHPPEFELSLSANFSQGLCGLYLGPCSPQIPAGRGGPSLLFGGVWVDVHKLPALWGEGSPEAHTSQFWSRHLPKQVSSERAGAAPPDMPPAQASQILRQDFEEPVVSHLPTSAPNMCLGHQFLEQTSGLKQSPHPCRAAFCSWRCPGCSDHPSEPGAHPSLPSSPRNTQASLGAGLALFYFAFSSLKLLSWAFSYTNDTYKK